MKTIIYNGIKLYYNSFSSMEIMKDIYEVELFNNSKSSAKIMVDVNQMNKL